MKRKRFSEEQIIAVVKEVEADAKSVIVMRNDSGSLFLDNLMIAAHRGR